MSAVNPHSTGGWTTHTASESRSPKDLYPTREEATRCLLHFVKFRGMVWECASGRGHISRILEAAGHEVVSTDKYAGEYDFGGELDFFDVDQPLAPNIVTNPAYMCGREFVEHALEFPDMEKICFFVPWPWLANVGIKDLFERVGYPAQMILMVPPFDVDTGTERGTVKGNFRHCWLVWDAQHWREPYSKFLIVDWRKPETWPHLA